VLNAVFLTGLLGLAAAFAWGRLIRRNDRQHAIDVTLVGRADEQRETFTGTGSPTTVTDHFWEVSRVPGGPVERVEVRGRWPMAHHLGDTVTVHRRDTDEGEVLIHKSSVPMPVGQRLLWILSLVVLIIGFFLFGFALEGRL